MIDENYCVYMHINKINNKVYIGQTCQNKMIVQLTKDNNIVQIFDSGCEAERQTGIKNANIFRAIKTGICAGGYRWKYYEEEVA